MIFLGHNPPIHKLLEGVECPSLSVWTLDTFDLFPPHILVAVNTHKHSKCTMQKWCILWCRPSQRPTSEFRAHDAHCSSLRSKHLLIGKRLCFSEWFTANSVSQSEGGGGGLSLLPIYHFMFYDIVCSSPSSSPKMLAFLLFLLLLREPVHTPCLFVVLPPLFPFLSLTIRILSMRQTKC